MGSPIFSLLLLSLSACAAAAPAKPRVPASDPLPRCWKAHDPQVHDGLYRISIPATDALTARDVQRILASVQAFGVASHEVSSVGDSIVIEAQFVTLDQAKRLGYPTQQKLEGLVGFVLKDDVPYLARGVTISCLAEQPRRHH
jgi:hypothetical protein